MRSHLFKYTLSAFMLVLMFGLLGCHHSKSSERESAPSDSLDVINISDKEDNQKAKTTDETKPQSAMLLFDASISMKGYLTSSQDSRFRGVISSFLTFAPQVKCYLYGERQSPAIEKQDFKNKLDNRDIAWSSESDLITMVETMTKHVEQTGNLCFLVTDAIMSGSNEQISNSPNKSFNIIHREEMSNELASIIEKYADSMSALIVRYKAKFDGKYSCYNNAPKTLTNKDRPFFMIVLGKWEHVKYIEEKLKTTKSQSSLKTAYSNLVMIGDQPSYSKISLSYSEGIKTNPSQSNKLIIKKEFRQNNIVLSSDVSALPDYMQAVEYMNQNVDFIVEYRNKAPKPLDNSCYDISINQENGKTIMKLSIKASRIIGSKLTFRLKYALPEWINQYSDDDDSDISNSNLDKLNKTFNLKYFVVGFTHLQKEQYIKEQVLEFK